MEGERFTRLGERFLMRKLRTVDGGVLPYVTARQSRLRQLRLAVFDDVTGAFLRMLEMNRD